jgi:hypothetical protein
MGSGHVFPLPLDVFFVWKFIFEFPNEKILLRLEGA